MRIQDSKQLTSFYPKKFSDHKQKVHQTSKLFEQKYLLEDSKQLTFFAQKILTTKIISSECNIIWLKLFFGDSKQLAFYFQHSPDFIIFFTKMGFRQF